jgi:cytochrome c-type biogenesis protein CcmH
MRVVLLTIMLCWALGPGGVAAQVPADSKAAPLSADPALEARVLKIAEELRCLVCQNETIAASQADLAKDLRQQIREQLTQGRTQPQILEFMSQRYGDFVLYRPPLQLSTVLLWAGPFVLLLVAAGVLLVNIRRRDPSTEPAPLTPAELQRAQRLLDDAGDPT